MKSEPDVGWYLYLERVFVGNTLIDEIKKELEDTEWKQFNTGWVDYDYDGIAES
jgi:hypothetical protein